MRGEVSHQGEEAELKVSDAHTAKNYAVTSFLKLLTARVVRLEQEMARHKKVSVVMLTEGEAKRKKGYMPDVRSLDTASDQNDDVAI